MMHWGGLWEVKVMRVEPPDGTERCHGAPKKQETMWALDPGLPASTTVREKFLLYVSLQSVVFCYSPTDSSQDQMPSPGMYKGIP